MARISRRDLIEPAEVGVYHCVQRAVRRAWLCGQDPVTGKNVDHRKVWIQERSAFLAGQLSDEEVARRWWNLFPGRKTDDDKPAEPESHESAMLVADGEALHQRRQTSPKNFLRWISAAVYDSRPPSSPSWKKTGL